MRTVPPCAGISGSAAFVALTIRKFTGKDLNGLVGVFRRICP